MGIPDSDRRPQPCTCWHPPALTPHVPHLGNLGKAPRDPEAGQLGMVPEGLGFVSSSPPPYSVHGEGSPPCLGVLCEVMISVFLKFICY